MKKVFLAKYSIEVNGIVQGVGFRPYIYKLAEKYKLGGAVFNTQNGVQIDIQGDKYSLEKFMEELPFSAPKLAQIESISVSQMVPEDLNKFRILKSSRLTGNKTLISPDISVCDDCLKELFDPGNRRHNYPFINCTNCGPRYTIIENIPYDRKNTTMKFFDMCTRCIAEYNDPGNRRFHAQPNACPDCGPKIWLEDIKGILFEKDTIKIAVDKLMDGKIIAIKGLGGFHLAVDATNENAVLRLREKKAREAKPLAIMLPDISSVKKIVEIDDNEEMILTDYQRPIVLLKKRNNQFITNSVAPGNKRFGVMLPYTPLHYLILCEIQKRLSSERIAALVMTSANLSEEPIVISNNEAKKRLGDIADLYLLHDREILIRSDDSVIFTANKKQRIIRRSRGFIPKPIALLHKTDSILGVGAELKNTICIAKNKYAFISQYIGDLTNLLAYNFFIETIKHTQRIMDAKPNMIARDLHPDYLSSKWANESNGHKIFQIQHHHAHMASCMLENKLNDDAIGIILDGTGYGYDSSIWGGEILIGNYSQFERFAHLEKIPIAGGDSGIREPWKIGLSYLHHAYDKDIPKSKILEGFNSSLITEALEKNINSYDQSSAGRLFDAVSFLAGGPSKIRYEAEAAIILTQAVNSFNEISYDFDEFDPKGRIIPLKKLIRSIFNDILNGSSFTTVANRFHFTFTNILLQAAITAREYSMLNNIVLSGGVFQNEILSAMLENKLRETGFKVFVNSIIPANDGGISIGQISIVNDLLTKKLDNPVFIN